MQATPILSPALPTVEDNSSEQKVGKYSIIFKDDLLFISEGQSAGESLLEVILSNSETGVLFPVYVNLVHRLIGFNWIKRG
jgi:hypothetical protein